MKKRRKIQIGILILFLMVGIASWGLKSKADTYSKKEAGDIESIGTYKEAVGEYSYVGVKVLWDDEVECFAVDSYLNSENDTSGYRMSNINGVIQRVYASRYSDSDSPIHLTHINDQTGRFKVRCDMIRKERTDYSVILETYCKGEMVSQLYEITGAAVGEFNGNVGLHTESFRLENVYVGGHEADGRSYVYRIYSPRMIEPDGEELSLEEHGGKMVTAGKAYVHKNGKLVLTQLPTATMTKEGYSCKIEGWYSAKEGGSKYEVGDMLEKGDVLHARWSITPKKYNVTCIDIRGNSPDGEVLGQNTWQADYGTEVNAETQGTNTTTGAYYAHCIYKDATKAKVTTTGATVYRYFSYETYPVEFIDVIKGGVRDGEILNRCVESREYKSVVKGSELGIDRTAGAYYEGYCYDSYGSGTVLAAGLVVKRYFKPVAYTIILDGNGAQEGNMTTTYECEYDKEVTLKINRFEKYSTVTLYQDAVNNSVNREEVLVKQSFLGWSREKNGSVCYSDNETLKNVTDQEKTITLYAVWSEETVTLPELSAPLGYQFLGWAEGPEAAKGFKQINITDSLELYAILQKCIVKYHVEYYKEKVDGEYELTSNYEFEGYTGDEAKLSLDNTIYPGFSLDQASSTISGTIKADGSLILCAYYRRNSYYFEYDLNGGVLQDGEALEKEKIKFGTNMTITSIVPQREGYQFLGWCQDTDDTHTLFQARDSFVMQNHDVTMHAQWKRLSFKVTYDNNAKYSMISEITGVVPDTEYMYQKDSYVSEVLFESEVGKMLSWNTKPDGSGISVLPGANIKGLFDSWEELTLYAIWEQKVSDNNASFKVILYKENAGEKEIIDTLKLSGRAGEKASIALLRIYQKKLQNESVVYFYKGYEVVNVEELEQLISLDSSTELSLEIKERECEVSFKNGADENSDGITAKYQEKYRLPESISDGIKIDRFEDDLGNYYFPGDEIVLERNLELTIQQAIYLHDEIGDVTETISYVARGKDFVLPELTKIGYRFLGWYDSYGEFAGSSGEIVKNITKRCDYYARWSDPLSYSITFDMDNLDVKILEGEVSYHQYTKETILPNKDQVVVPDGYQFDGWYDSADTTKTLLTKIAASDYGDKVLKPCISKKEVQFGDESDKEKNETLDSEEKGEESKDIEENNTENDSEDSSVTEEGDSGVKKQSNTANEKQVGDSFWKGKLKYRILSVQNGKEKVEIIAVKKGTITIKISSKVMYGNISYKVTVIGKKAFYKANKLKKVVIPNSVVWIKSGAFSNMKNLRRVTIGKDVRKIESKAFYKSKKLTTIIIKGKKITVIGKKAFYQINAKGTLQILRNKKKTYQKLLKASKIQKTLRIAA